MKNINERCPLQSECGHTTCKYQHRELDCRYYDANSRPGCEIEDQEERRRSGWDARMNPQSILDDPPAAAKAQQGASVLPINGFMTYLPIGSLYPHPDNPRKDLGDLTELADSIRANGIFQNLTVVPLESGDEEWRELAKQYQEHPTEELRNHMNRLAASPSGDAGGLYRVIIGHRRLAAAKLAGLTEVPCVIAQMTAKEQMQTMLLENMQRSELTVYEQAQGFQMMLDLGSSVEEIAEKSGFSTTTIRRRVKMMELDQEVLKEVSTRQLSLLDFDKLAQIEDITARNECLSKIGTSNFDSEVKYKLRRQAVQKKLPLIMELLEAASAKAIPENERYSSKYNTISSCYIADWQEGTPLIPQKVSGQILYYIENYSDRIVFFEKSKRAEPVRRSAEEIEREKRIAEAWSQLDEKAAVAYELRSSFVKNLSYGKRNAEQVLRGALIYGIVRANAYLSSDDKTIRAILKLEDSGWADERAVKAVDALHELSEKQIPALVYALFDDNAKEGWADSYRKAYPKYSVSAKLKGLYAWLTSLGYEMSEEEQLLMNGTHELFRIDAAAVTDTAESEEDEEADEE